MGCDFSRQHSKNMEELRIQAGETLLGLSTIECNEFDMSFSRYSIGGYLNANQLKASMEALGIPGSSMDSFPFSAYLKPFAEGEKGYSLKRLVCVGILLGKGAPDKKGELLLQNYDRDCSGEIDSDEFNSMIDDMTLVSFTAAIELAKEADPSMCSMLAAYLKNLNNAKKIFRIYVHFIMSMGREEGIITPENFLHTFNDQRMQQLCTSSGVRKLALELYEEQIHN